MKYLNHLLVLLLAVIGIRAAAGDRWLEAEVVEKVTGFDGKTYLLEELGRPLTPKRSNVNFVTTDAAGHRIVWADIWSPDRHGIAGFDLEDGTIHWIGTTADFGPHAHKTLVVPHGNDTVYVIAGKVFKIYKYTVSSRETELLHTFPPGSGNYYYEAYGVGPDGKIYLGTYPRNIVIGIDPQTDRAFELPPMTDKPQQKYVNAAAVDDDNILYAPTGHNRPELYAYHTVTGEKKQILTAEESDLLSTGKIRIPEVFLKDGKVYTRIAGRYFRCTPNGLIPAPEITAWPDSRERFRANGRYPDRKISGTEFVVDLSEAGLQISDGKSNRYIPVDFPPVGHQLFRFGSRQDGILYGSGIFPAGLFGLNLETLLATDYGKVTTGGVQSYDMLATSKGLLISSYMGATLDLFDPARPREKGRNPRSVAQLDKDYQQERIYRLTPVGERYVYAGSVPIKGILTGAVLKVDLVDESVRVWRGVLPDQSVNDLTLCPDGRFLFGTGSVFGGTGSVPTAKAADLFLWDTREDKIVWTGKADDSIIDYLESGLTSDGKIFALGRTANQGPDKHYCFLVFDPEKREIIFRQSIPARFSYNPISFPAPAGPEQLNYFMLDGVVYCYSPAAQKIRRLFHHPTLEITQDMHIAGDYLYYLDDSRIIRVKLFGGE